MKTGYFEKEFQWDERKAVDFAAACLVRYNETGIVETSKVLQEFTKPKIESREYEILSFKDEHDEILTKDYVGLFVRQNGQCNTDKHCIEYEFQINSVKRIRDGEIFSIDDYVDGFATSNRKITGFVIDGDEMKINLEGGANNLRYIQKSKKEKILTTSDGKEIFEGDTVFAIDINYTIIRFDNVKKDDVTFETDCYILGYYSTLELAEEFKINNRPCISVNDLLKIKDWNMSPFTLVQIKRIVRSK